MSLRLIEGFVIGLGLPRLIVIVVVGVVTARVIEIGLLYYSKSAIFLRFSDPITEDARLSKHRPISFLKRFYLELHPHALTLPTCKCMFFIMSRFFLFSHRFAKLLSSCRHFVDSLCNSCTTTTNTHLFCALTVRSVAARQIGVCGSDETAVVPRKVSSSPPHSAQISLCLCNTCTFLLQLFLECSSS